MRPGTDRRANRCVVVSRLVTAAATAGAVERDETSIFHRQQGRRQTRREARLHAVGLRLSHRRSFRGRIRPLLTFQQWDILP